MPQVDVIPRKSWQVEYVIEKWTSEADRSDGVPPEVHRGERNVLCNEGLGRLLDLLIGASTTPYDATHARLGVGNGTTAATVDDTDLSGSLKQFKVIDSPYPTRVDQTVTWKATFLGSEANFGWSEWCIDAGTANSLSVVPPMLNRKVDATMGIKGSGAIWTLTVSVTLA